MGDRFRFISVVFSLGVISTAAWGAGWQVGTDFPGGSAEVLQLDESKGTLTILPRWKQGSGWRSWWYFRLSGLTPGQKVRLEVNGDTWSKPTRAWYSLDNQNWRPVDKAGFAWTRRRYSQRVNAHTVWFAHSPPYTEVQLQALTTELKGHASVETLARTRGGRPVPLLVFKSRREPATGCLWVMARQHATEVAGSWVADGLARWLTTPQAATLREHTTVYIVPIMDVDSVAEGVGGKQKEPIDHNRDWCDEPHWPSVAATQKRLRAEQQAGRLRAVIDIHCGSDRDRELYFHVSGEEILSNAQVAMRKRFLRLARRELTGPIAFRGQLDYTSARYDRAFRRIAHNWASLHLGPECFATTLELPWNNSDCTPTNHRTVGAGLGRTLTRYVEE